MFKTIRFALVSLIVWFCATSHAQSGDSTSYQIAPPESWVKSREIQPATRQAHIPGGQNFVLLDRQSNVGKESTYHRRAYQIVNEAGREGGAQVYINFDPSYERLTIHHLRLLRGGETHDRLDPTKIQILQQERELDRLLYNGQRSALIILDDVRIGDIIDVAYTVHGYNPIFGGNFIDVIPLGWGVPVQAQYLRLLVPTGRKIHSHIQGKADPEVHTTESNGVTETEWASYDLAAIETEDNIPASTIVYPFLELSEFDSWHEVVQWALPLYAAETEGDPLVDDAVRQIRERNLGGEDTIIAALDFVQQEVRYLGIEMGPGSHQPSRPGEVLKRRFGDCKDKARLLTTVLAKLGVDASPILVHSTRRENVNEWLPSPYAFDHVIVAVEFRKIRWFLDPTLTYQRGAKLDLRSVGGYGPYLNIRAGTWGLEDATIGIADAYNTTVHESFNIPSFDAPTIVTVKTVSVGASANYLRAYFASRSREQVGREYLEYYTRYYSDISSTAPIEINDDTHTNTVNVVEHYAIKNFFQKAAQSDVLVAELYPTAVDGYMRAPNLTRRQYPYALAYPADVSCLTEIHLPEEWPATNSEVTIDDPAFKFRQMAKGHQRQLMLGYSWSSHRDRVEVGRMAEFSGKLGKARALLGYQLSYNSALTGMTGVRPNWRMIILSGIVLILCGLGAVFLIRKRNPEPPVLVQRDETKPIDPYSYSAQWGSRAKEGLGGWLILVCLGLLLRPLFLLGTLLSGARAYFDGNLWQALTTPTNPAYQRHYAWATPFELSLNLCMLVLSITLLVLFFRRSFLFPRAMQILLAASVGVAIYSSISIHLFAGITAEMMTESSRQLIQAIFAAAVWIPYFSFSKRVKRTFVR